MNSEATEAGSHGVVKDGAHTWHWKSHSYKQLTHSQLKNPAEVGKKKVLNATKRTKKWYLAYVKGNIYRKFRHNVEL